MANDILLTEKQQARIERNQAICKDFNRVREQYPTSSLERVFSVVAKGYGLTNCSIRAIVKREGLC